MRSIPDELSKVLTKSQILTDPADLLNYGRDWTRLHEPKPTAIVFPEKIEDVVKLVHWARKNEISLVPSGGRTGLSAGAVATNSEVVVSMNRMNKILDFNAVDRLVRVQAGVITEELQNFVTEKGFYYPVDLASRGSSQIGGNIATNAGGTKVIRYGHTRDWVAGLTVVTGAGDILELDRCLIKDNSGYDLKHLFIASEGTLGIIVEAVLRVTEAPQNPSVLLFGTDSLSKVVDILKVFRRDLKLTGFEFFTDRALHYVCSQQKYSEPFDKTYPVYALIEFENPNSAFTDLALKIFDECTEKNLAFDGVMSQSAEQADQFWKYRENISESLSTFKPYKNDISVQISAMPTFVAEAEQTLKAKFPNVEFVWFGHIGDGNLHINILRGQMPEREFTELIPKMSHALFALLQKYKGSISAEHGIGLVKKPYLEYTLAAAEINYMKQTKKIFDPDGILNPGKIFDLI